MNETVYNSLAAILFPIQVQEQSQVDHRQRNKKKGEKRGKKKDEALEILPNVLVLK